MSTEETFHVALTGHRPNKLAGYNMTDPFYVALQSWLEHIIETGLAEHHHLSLGSGLALGADATWSRAILAMRDRFPGRIRFVAEVPVMTQASQWPDERDRAFWQEQVDRADRVNVYAESYSPRAMQLRNEGMIRPAQLLLAVWDGSSGGTGHAVRFARQQGIPIFQISPTDVTRRASSARYPAGS